MEWYTLEQVRVNDGSNGVYWIVIDDMVYDITSYVILNKHPGGNEPLENHAGTDASERFAEIHSDKARLELDQYLIGRVAKPSMYSRVRDVFFRLFY